MKNNKLDSDAFLKILIIKLYKKKIPQSQDNRTLANMSRGGARGLKDGVSSNPVNKFEKAPPPPGSQKERETTANSYEAAKVLATSLSKSQVGM